MYGNKGALFWTKVRRKERENIYQNTDNEMKANLKPKKKWEFDADLKYGIFSGSEGDFGSFGYGGSSNG